MSDTESLKIKRLRHVARILGGSSAAALALAEYDRRRADGEEVDIIESRRSLFVSPSGDHP